MREQEKRVREQRTIQATSKNLIGPSGKLGCVVRYMGEKMWDTGGGMSEVHHLGDGYGDWWGEHSDIPTLDMEENVRTTGYRFDGLSSGLHLEIEYKSAYHSLTVKWRGTLVYQETCGELEAYVPGEDWEGAIDDLYNKFAIRRAKRVRAAEAEAERREVTEEKRGFLRHLRDAWGV
jgi:hypothetical protein